MNEGVERMVCREGREGIVGVKEGIVGRFSNGKRECVWEVKGRV